MNRKTMAAITALVFATVLGVHASYAEQNPGEWLIGRWDGTLDTSEVSPLEGPDRTLIVTGVASDGKATGVWGISGKSLHRVEITPDGPQLRLITPASSLVVLRHREDDQMDGVLTSKDGKTFVVVFSKRDRTIAPPIERHPGEALIGKWEGALDNPPRTPMAMIVTGVAPDGGIEGVWGPRGRPLYKAQITLNGAQVTVRTVAQNLAALDRTRPGQLEGLFTLTDGQVFPIHLAKEDGPVTPSAERHPGESLIGKWEGALKGASGNGDERRTFIVTGVEPDGTTQGFWGIHGKGLGKAQITLEGAQLKIVTLANAVVLLTRTRSDLLEGVLTFKDGNTFPIRLAKSTQKSTITLLYVSAST